MSNLNVLTYNIRKWAKERELYKHGDTKTQCVKLQEEVGELARGILKEDDKLIKDSIGDIFVVLTNFANLAGTSLEECATEAWLEIRGRKGTIKNNTFIKED